MQIECVNEVNISFPSKLSKIMYVSSEDYKSFGN